MKSTSSLEPALEFSSARFTPLLTLKGFFPPSFSFYEDLEWFADIIFGELFLLRKPQDKLSYFDEGVKVSILLNLEVFYGILTSFLVQMDGI